jgi:hypothetical protein
MSIPPTADVTASELAAFRYCAKAWHLEHVSRARASEAAELRRDAGVTKHHWHGAQVHAGGWLARHRWPATIALLLTALLLFGAALRM